MKARARDREVAQRSSLGSSVARQEGRRAWDTAPTSWVSCSICNQRLCNTLQTAGNRLGHKDGKLRTVRFCSFSRLCCLGPYSLQQVAFFSALFCNSVWEQLCRRALHARADDLGAADHLLCEGAVCTRVRDRVLRRCHAAPKRCGSELR